MLCGGAGTRRSLRWGATVLAAALAITASHGSADARRKYQPAYSSIVVDANTGAVLQSTNAKSSRYPASLTKVMTLYLLFEQLERGELKLDSRLKVSARASGQAPSKLGLKPGETIDVASAIKVLVTKSANDIAVVVAEAIGGSEAEFAKLMTRKARVLGMSNTNYRNASGLPDDEQITTAQDQALLGRAIRDRFPKYFDYFSLQAFHYRGKRMTNHNRLLSRVNGVDGIKTGYTYASGFNLLSSAKRGDRYIVAVVIGGRSGKWRDDRMAYLINRYIGKASNRRTVPMISDRIEIPPRKPKFAAATAPKPEPTPAAPETRAVAAAPKPGSKEPIMPNAVKTVPVKTAAAKGALAMVPMPSRSFDPPPVKPNGVSVRTIVTVKNDPPPLPAGPQSDLLSFAPVKTASADDGMPVSSTAAAPVKTVGKPQVRDWAIQVGAFDDENDARKRLTAAKAQAKDLLGDANPFTERVTKGEKTLFRARFTGLDKSKAEAACTHLKRGEIPCMLLKN